MGRFSQSEQWLFPSWWGSKETLVMIDLGIDESETTKPKLLVVSALIGQTARMEKLARSWESELKRYGIDFFHSKEHWNRRSKAYHGISMQKRTELLARLIGHIHKFATTGISVYADPEEYNRTTSPRFRSNWGSAYAFAIQLLMLLTALELMQHQ